VEDSAGLYRGQDHPPSPPKSPSNICPFAEQLLFLGFFKTPSVAYITY
jgi:hypothetical protein